MYDWVSHFLHICFKTFYDCMHSYETCLTEEYKAVMEEISKMDGLIEEISDGYKIHARANTTSLSSHQRLRHQVFSDIGMRRKSSFSLMC
jgi:hypothetical protein